jgi:hypothetical protein
MAPVGLSIAAVDSVSSTTGRPCSNQISPVYREKPPTVRRRPLRDGGKAEQVPSDPAEIAGLVPPLNKKAVAVADCLPPSLVLDVVRAFALQCIEGRPIKPRRSFFKKRPVGPPSKPSKPGFEGFDGCFGCECPE